MKKEETDNNIKIFVYLMQNFQQINNIGNYIIQQPILIVQLINTHHRKFI